MRRAVVNDPCLREGRSFNGVPRSANSLALTALAPQGAKSHLAAGGGPRQSGPRTMVTSISIGESIRLVIGTDFTSHCWRGRWRGHRGPTPPAATAVVSSRFRIACSALLRRHRGNWRLLPPPPSQGKRPDAYLTSSQLVGASRLATLARCSQPTQTPPLNGSTTPQPEQTLETKEPLPLPDECGSSEENR